MTQQIELAMNYAYEAHKGILRKDNKTPYIIHPVAVFNMLKYEAGVTDEHMLAAALLHDVIEDCKHISVQDMSNKFSKETMELVHFLTKLDNEDSVTYITKLYNTGSFNALTVKLADRLSNVKDYIYDGNTKYAIKYAGKAQLIIDRVKREYNKKLHHGNPLSLVEQLESIINANNT